MTDPAEPRYAIAMNREGEWLVLDQRAVLTDPIVCRCARQEAATHVATALNLWVMRRELQEGRRG